MQNGGVVRLGLWTQTSPLSEMMLSCECLPNVSIKLALTDNGVCHNVNCYIISVIRVLE